MAPYGSIWAQGAQIYLFIYVWGYPPGFFFIGPVGALSTLVGAPCEAMWALNEGLAVGLSCSRERPRGFVLRRELA